MKSIPSGHRSIRNMPNKTIATPIPKMQVPDVPQSGKQGTWMCICACLLFSVSPKYKDPNKYKVFHPATFLFLATYPACLLSARPSSVAYPPVEKREAFEDFVQPLALHSSLTPVYD
ncbi:hypothetical protein VTJ04DRAFT_3461 [Mycothermus thermophilus]|uniref:uncharacterized protein n=1 Tax=Humicola insolens TaxID=85995 RepID=UPI003744A6CF